MQHRVRRRLSGRACFPTALSALLLTAATATAQTPDYRRAEQFLSWNTATMVSGDQVNPVWLKDGNRFWYRNKTKAGSEFVLVDPVRASRAPLFDHARLAAALSLANDTSYEPHKLPFSTFDFVDGERAIEFNASKKRFRCELGSYRCTVGDTVANRMAYVGSPDSVWEAFVHQHNLYIRPKKGGDSIQLTTDGVEYWSYGVTAPRPQQLLTRSAQNRRPSLRWSPDSKKIAVYRTDERRVEHMHYISMTSQRPRHFSQPYALPGDSIVPVPNIHIVDVASKQNIALKLDPVPNQLSLGGSPLDSVWTKDSKKIRLHYLTRGSKSMYLVEADAENGTLRMLAMDTSKTFVETNPQGRPSWWVSEDASDVIWWSERDGWPHLWRFDGRTGATSTVLAKGSENGGNGNASSASRTTPALKNQITAGAWAAGDVLYVDQAAKQLYFTARGKEPGRLLYYAHLYRVNFDGSGLTLLTPEDANHRITFSPSGKYFVDSYSRIEKPPVTVLRSAVDGKIIRKLEEADISRLEEIRWEPGEVFTVKARDGVTDLYGVIYFPTSLDPNKKYPVIENIYPGPQVGSVGQWAFTAGGENRALAELGFIVIQLDHLGTPLRSKAFHDNYYGNFIDNGLPDHIAAVKQLGARYPFMDLDRVGIYGHSGGGFASTDAVLRFPEFYKVAVSGAGNHDNRSYNIYWAEKYQGLLKKEGKSDNFEASANKTYARNLQGKLLLMHGDMDDNVHPAMTIQLVDELIKANKDFDLVIAPNRAHGLNEPYFIRRRWDFFVRHLLGVEPPANFEIQRAPGGGGQGDGPDDADGARGS
jgi:dipeptidyl aminopeptidase/acylaminoacyl peptidase